MQAFKNRISDIFSQGIQNVRGKNKMPLIMAFLIGLFDQLSKLAVVYLLNPGETLHIFGNFVRLSYVLNEGAAFGFFSDYTKVLISINILIVLMLFGVILTQPVDSFMLRVITGLLLGGSIGNLIDRVRIGAVVDFIDLGWFPAFNIADSALVIGIGLVIGYALGLFREVNESKHSK